MWVYLIAFDVKGYFAGSRTNWRRRVRIETSGWSGFRPSHCRKSKLFLFSLYWFDSAYLLRYITRWALVCCPFNWSLLERQWFIVGNTDEFLPPFSTILERWMKYTICCNQLWRGWDGGMNDKQVLNTASYTETKKTEIIFIKILLWNSIYQMFMFTFKFLLLFLHFSQFNMF